MTRQEQKQEAIARMRMLKLHTNAINEFEKDDVINLSEHGGILYWLNEDQMQHVKAFEGKYTSVVYHVIHNITEFGELLAFLYVSDSEEEWDYDRDDIKDGYAYAYVKNLDDDMCSEFGSIGIKPQFGGIVRTC
jgi:hypothetical protein